VGRIGHYFSLNKHLENQYSRGNVLLVTVSTLVGADRPYLRRICTITPWLFPENKD